MPQTRMRMSTVALQMPTNLPWNVYMLFPSAFYSVLGYVAAQVEWSLQLASKLPHVFKLALNCLQFGLGNV
eukprot:383623-Amphidinium_carterae.1